MVKETVLIDTGAFYARYVVRDEHHQEAILLWGEVQSGGIPCMTTNFVLSELITLLVYRFGTRQALQAAREIYASHAIKIAAVDMGLELKGLDWLDRFPDQGFSMTDAVSFAVMEKERIKTAFTFDHHFDVAGYLRFAK